MIKFNEVEEIKSVKGALELREEINVIVDQICEEGFNNICWLGIGGTWASSLQVEVHMRERSSLDFFVVNAAEYLATGDKRINEKTIVIISSVSGTTEEMVKALRKVKEVDARVLGFIDKENTILANEVDWRISYPENEQLKFFMTADRFMYNAGEFEEYEDLYKNFDEFLPEALVEVSKDSEEFAVKYAEEHHDDKLHYFVGAGNQYGGTYSHAMCYWEEQHWLRTKSIHSAEFFHGMFEIVDRDTNVTVFVGEDSQRKLSERVANFLPKVSARYTVIDTKDYKLPGIKEEYRQYVSHLVMRKICDRIDIHIERINCHPMEIRRYYRVIDY